MGLPTATVRMRGPDGIARTSTGMGTGPVDAAYKAIDSQVRVQVTHLTSHCTERRPCCESVQWVCSGRLAQISAVQHGTMAGHNSGHMLTALLAC